MSTNAGVYDLSRMYRSGSHGNAESLLGSPAAPDRAEDRLIRASEERVAMVAYTLRPAAAAVIAYSEYLMAVADLPREHQAVLDVLRRQAQTVLAGLGDLVP